MTKKRTDQSAGQGEVVPLKKPDYESLYMELLYQVGHKHLGETRHQTALRYLRNAERLTDQAAQTDAPKEDKA